jgi:hypothetical protein
MSLPFGQPAQLASMNGSAVPSRQPEAILPSLCQTVRSRSQSPQCRAT